MASQAATMAKLALLVLVAASTLMSTASAITLTNTTADDDVSPSPSPSLTVYEMLTKYGFPLGILPEGVQGYQLKPDGSSFEVYLLADCEFRAAKKYQVHYSSRVAGSIRDGAIDSLEGVKVKVMLSWFRVNEVNIDGDQIRLHVGPLTKSFSEDSFAVSPVCN